MKNISITSIVFLSLLFFIGNTSFAQDLSASSSNVAERYTAHNKGKIYMYWGWNHGRYSRSDVRFQGDDHDFTLHNVKGHDRQTKFTIYDYFRIDQVTTPQTNVRLGYFISDNYNISLGIDHMKYFMTEGQTANISGYIDVPEGNPYNGIYNYNPININDDFVHLEHTNGLNYVNLQIERYDDLGSLLGGTWNMDIFQINVYEGFGAGVIIPRTDATLLNRDRYDEFHLAGYGVSIHQGLNFTFLKHYFIQFELKEGYINMPNIRTTSSTSDKASQHFFFVEPTFMFGGIFRL